MEQVPYIILQVSALIALLLFVIPPLGRYWAALVEGNISGRFFILGWIESTIYRLAGVDPKEEMRWTAYLKCYLYLTLWSGIALILIQMLQSYLPFNPQHMKGVSFLQAFDTSMSFITNTNWQSYAPETTLSYGTQMWGLTVQNFISAGAGSAVLMALIRGLSRRSYDTIGNFWADLVRNIVYLYLPLSILLAIFNISQGSVQTLDNYVTIETMEGASQTIPLGPAASQVAIKQLGTNGGGFFNANSAHPFENPTPLSNFFQMLSIILMPAVMVYAYGVLIKSRSHAWLLLSVMFLIWAVGLTIAFTSDFLADPFAGASPVREGKELRVGRINSILWATLTTATANGSVNAMMDSLSPLAGGVALFNMKIGEVVFGGVGVGLSSMLMFVLMTVFLCGLMVGRTPEYLGKKVEKKEMQWVLVAMLGPTAIMLLGAGISLSLPEGRNGISVAGPHGMTQMLYAFASASTNNGSAFSGFRSYLDYYHIVLGIVFVIGRLLIIVPTLALAGAFAPKKISPPSVGMLSTSNFMFAVLLIAVILVIGLLTFFPALSLGPLLEHLLMLRGDTFPQEGL
jgi:K+-transporting ATPase ATPase A chain